MKTVHMKYGFKEFERNIYFNIFIILQITAALILMIYCVSSIAYISKFYSPIKKYIDGEGLCTTGVPNYTSLDEISDCDYVDSVYSYNAIGGFYNNNNAYYNDDITYAYINSYDTAFINSFKPIMEKGTWLSECDSDSDSDSNNDVINAVISYSTEYSIGDEIAVVIDPDTETMKELRFKVVGMLSEGAKIFNAYSSPSEIVDASSLYANYYSNQHSGEILLLTEQNDNISGYPGMSLIKFKDGYSEEEYDDFYNQLAMNYNADGIKLSKINDASLKEINEQKVMILPLIIGISILIVVSVFSMSAISSNRQLKNYGVYNISGGTKSDCVFIQIWNIIYCCVLSCGVAYLFYSCLKASGKLNGSIIAFGKDEVLACVALIMLTLIASAIMPSLIIGKSETKDILQEVEV